MAQFDSNKFMKLGETRGRFFKELELEVVEFFFYYYFDDLTLELHYKRTVFNDGWWGESFEF